MINASNVFQLIKNGDAVYFERFLCYVMFNDYFSSFLVTDNMLDTKTFEEFVAVLIAKTEDYEGDVFHLSYQNQVDYSEKVIGLQRFAGDVKPSYLRRMISIFKALQDRAEDSFVSSQLEVVNVLTRRYNGSFMQDLYNFFWSYDLTQSYTEGFSLNDSQRNYLISAKSKFNAISVQNLFEDYICIEKALPVLFADNQTFSKMKFMISNDLASVSLSEMMRDVKASSDSTSQGLLQFSSVLMTVQQSLTAYMDAHLKQLEALVKNLVEASEGLLQQEQATLSIVTAGTSQIANLETLVKIANEVNESTRSLLSNVTTTSDKMLSSLDNKLGVVVELTKAISLSNDLENKYKLNTLSKVSAIVANFSFAASTVVQLTRKEKKLDSPNPFRAVDPI